MSLTGSNFLIRYEPYCAPPPYSSEPRQGLLQYLYFHYINPGLIRRLTNCFTELHLFPFGSCKTVHRFTSSIYIILSRFCSNFSIYIFFVVTIFSFNCVFLPSVKLEKYQNRKSRPICPCYVDLSIFPHPKYASNIGIVRLHCPIVLGITPSTVC